MDTNQEYDKLCSYALTNIYTLTKEEKSIRIKPHDDKTTLFFINIAMAVGGIFNKKVCLVCGPLYYLYFVIRYFGFKGFKNLKFSWKDKNINIPEIAQFMSTGTNNPPDIFERIYKEYYEHV